MTHINIAAGALNMSVWIGEREDAVFVWDRICPSCDKLAAIFQALSLSLSACLCLSGTGIDQTHRDLGYFNKITNLPQNSATELCHIASDDQCTLLFTVQYLLILSE